MKIWFKPKHILCNLSLLKYNVWKKLPKSSSFLDKHIVLNGNKLQRNTRKEQMDL